MAARIRASSNSIARQVEIFRAQDCWEPPLPWPESMQLPEDEVERTQVMGDFHNVLRARDDGYWLPHHAALAGEWALITLAIRKLVHDVTVNGPLVMNSAGTSKVRSASLDGLSVLTSQRNSLLKSLGLSATSLERDGAGKANAAANRTIAKAAEHSDLLA